MVIWHSLHNIAMPPQDMTTKMVLRVLLFLLLSFLFPPVLSIQAQEEEYGPPNLLKTVHTPFGRSEKSGANSGNTEREESDVIRAIPTPSSSRNLASRLLPERLYLPDRMVLGKPAKFVVKGKPGAYVALAMADRDKGAKPIYGQEIRLGPDRKVVSLCQIPASGVATLFVETPIIGDLIGQDLYFEAALWSREDFQDLRLAATVPAQQEGPGSAKANGVPIYPDIEQKRGIRIVPDSGIPLQLREKPGGYGAATLDGGRP